MLVFVFMSMSTAPLTRGLSNAHRECRTIRQPPTTTIFTISVQRRSSDRWKSFRAVVAVTAATVTVTSGTVPEASDARTIVSGRVTIDKATLEVTIDENWQLEQIGSAQQILRAPLTPEFAASL